MTTPRVAGGRWQSRIICPTWVSTLAQPIGIDDLLKYLVAGLHLPDNRSRTFEIGGAWNRPWTGVAVAVTLLGAHLALSSERSLEARLVNLAVLVGVILEMVQLESGTYRFTSGTVADLFPPPWLVAMWAQLATTFRFSLRPVIARPMRAALFGAAGGPIAFLAGERLGAVTLLPPLALGLLRLSIGWALALALFSIVVRRVVPEADAPRYRSVSMR